LITEKANLLKEKANKVAFVVAQDANKAQIKEAVERLLKVKVLKVNCSSMQGKAAGSDARAANVLIGRRRWSPCGKGTASNSLRGRKERQSRSWELKNIYPHHGQKVPHGLDL